MGELNGAQGRVVDIQGYYRPGLALVGKAMRPSKTFNDALASRCWRSSSRASAALCCVAGAMAGAWFTH